MTDEIIKHLSMYPLMTEQDIVKLIYQSEFGGGHFIKDTSASLKLIKDEFGSAPKTDHIFEDIGGGYVRLYISALDNDNFDADILNCLFTESSKYRTGTKDSLIDKLNSAEDLISKKYLEEYIASGCPMVSHSDIYRSAYSPAYRVLLKSLADLYLPFVEIKKKSRDKNITVAFDGKAAAGKTTAAALLESITCCTTIHADDFFLPFDMRTKARLNEPGGNIHYERMKKEVIDALGKDSFTYGRFNCSKGKITETVTAKTAPVTLIEGAYSTHPFFGNIYDIKVFFDIDSAEQEKRILNRNGKEMFKKFKDLWIPMENKYFNFYDIKNKCNFTVK